MTNQSFVEQQQERIQEGKPLAKRYEGRRFFNSLMATDKTIYSYGTHYPLAFQVETSEGKKWVVNTRGYSMTTSKHIGLCKSDICVELPRGAYNEYYDNDKKEVVEKALNDTLDKLANEIGKKKRKDTKVYKWLKYDYERNMEYLAMIK